MSLIAESIMPTPEEYAIELSEKQPDLKEQWEQQVRELFLRLHPTPEEQELAIHRIISSKRMTSEQSIALMRQVYGDKYFGDDE